MQEGQAHLPVRIGKAAILREEKLVIENTGIGGCRSRERTF